VPLRLVLRGKTSLAAAPQTCPEVHEIRKEIRFPASRLAESQKFSVLILVRFASQKSGFPLILG
ncbi:MAG: hypothetical protein V3V75_08630, partial [Thermoguttaceae bacterium]